MSTIKGRRTIFHPGSPSRGYKPQTKIFRQETKHLQKGRYFSQGSLYSLLSCELGQHLNEDVESNWGWQMMGQISTGGLNVVWYARVGYCNIVWFGMLYNTLVCHLAPGAQVPRAGLLGDHQARGCTICMGGNIHPSRYILGIMNMEDAS